MRISSAFLFAIVSCSAFGIVSSNELCDSWSSILIDSTWEVFNPNLEGSNSELAEYSTTGVISFDQDGKFKLLEGYLGASDGVILHPDSTDSFYALPEDMLETMRYAVVGDTVLFNIEGYSTTGMRMVVDRGGIFGISLAGAWEGVSEFTLSSTDENKQDALSEFVTCRENDFWRNIIIGSRFEVSNPNLEEYQEDFPSTGEITFHEDGAVELHHGFVAASQHLLHPDSTNSYYAIPLDVLAGVRYEIYDNIILLNIPGWASVGMLLVLDRGSIVGISLEGGWSSASIFSNQDDDTTASNQIIDWRQTLVGSKWQVLNPNLEGSQSELAEYSPTGVIIFHHDGKFELLEGYLGASNGVILHPNSTDSFMPYHGTCWKQ